MLIRKAIANSANWASSISLSIYRFSTSPIEYSQLVCLLLLLYLIRLHIAISLRLQQELDLEIVAEAEDGETAIELVNQTVLNIVLLDVDLLGIGGIEACHQIKQRQHFTLSAWDRNLKHVVKAVPAIARVRQRYSVVNGASSLWVKYDRIN